MDISKLETTLKENNQPKFRLNQIKKAIYQDGVSSFSKITSLPKDLREKLNEELPILSFSVEKILDSKDAHKALLKLNDGNFIETVLISPKPKIWSVCVSSQVGCALGCDFCATGKMGFKRNLSSEEITDQVLFWKQYLNGFRNSKFEIRNYDVSNIVYMGMGEPFLNWDNVRQSLKILMDKNLFAFGSRSISISTAGIPDGIKALAKEFPQINLAISLHFTTDEKRSKYMAINQQYNLGQLKTAIEEYIKQTKRKVFIEYLMIDNINDNIEDAENLVEFLKSIRSNYLLHVNLIRYHKTSGNFSSSSNNKIHKFKDYLDKNKISVTIRKSLGEEIFAACGQLAGK
ncbi:MAG: 23S rRNA (adenine(2503)-C(2))-methyltransferase RlmN [bacterium]|nr:23S rRNA (adenine(2503)-C(2))-methyltransferase RlmN [bacterium]